MRLLPPSTDMVVSAADLVDTLIPTWNLPAASTGDTGANLGAASGMPGGCWHLLWMRPAGSGSGLECAAALGGMIRQHGDWDEREREA